MILVFIFIDLNLSIVHAQRPADLLPMCESKELDISEFSPRFFNGSEIDSRSQFITTVFEEIHQYKLKENPARTVQVTKIRLNNREEAAQVGLSIGKYLTLSNSEEGQVYHSYPTHKNSELCYKTTDYVYLVREAFEAPLVAYMDGLDLDSVYHSLPWKIYASVHLALRVKRLHEAGYLYTFLNPFTIYMRSDFDMVLGDFRYLIDDLISGDNIPINRNWMAVLGFDMTYSPSELANGFYSRKGDVYSLGMILFKIWTQKARRNTQSSEEYRRDAFNYCDNVNSNTSDETQTEKKIKKVYCRYFHDTVKSMIEYEARERLALDDVIERFKTHTKEALNKYNKFRAKIEAQLNDLKTQKEGVEQEKEWFYNLTPVGDIKRKKGQLSNLRPIKDIKNDLVSLDNKILSRTIELDMCKPLEKILEEFFNVMIKPKFGEHAYVIRQLSDNQYLYDALEDQGKGILGEPVAEYIANISKQMNDDNRPSLLI